MLIIPKRKRRFARLLFWGSFVLEVIAAFFAAFPDERGAFAILCLFGLMIPLFAGRSMIEQLYLCPKCGSHLLRCVNRGDALMERPPQHCPHCGHKIEIRVE